MIDIDRNEKQTCPRRMEGLGPWERKEGLDGWRAHHMDAKLTSCDFCGSLHPDEFMDMVENGTVVNLTDKRYKAYIDSYKKFYYAHLSEEQRLQFLRLWNEGVASGKHISDRDGALPFFMQPIIEE